MHSLWDFYGQFLRALHRCSKCGWTGRGDYLESGNTYGDGIDKHCPKCRALYRFIQWSLIAPDEAPKE